jgi:hypothetical protein
MTSNNREQRRSDRGRPRAASGLLWALFAAAAIGPAHAASELSVATLQAYNEERPTGVIDWTEGYVEVAVVGHYDTARYGASHAKIRAIEDAENKSADTLFRLIRGINISSDARLAGDEKMEEALHSLIKQDRKMDVGKIENVSLAATFRVPLYGRKGLAQRIFDLLYAGQTQPGPLSAASGGGYSSVVFDASRLPAQPALFPRILNEAGETLYGPGDLNAEVVKRGVCPARYVAAGGAALSKDLTRLIGEKPLVIQVEQLAGDLQSDLVLKADEEARLREAKAGDALAEGRVLIVQASPAPAAAAR